MNNFKKLGLSTVILEALDQMGFEDPTPIQEKAIPLLLNKNPTDFIGLAQTGTGKTAAFGLPLLDVIDTSNGATQAIVMAPTRELGQQTAKQLKAFSQNNKSLNVEVVYGGAAIANQIKALKRPTQIVVATPGRLIDIINRKAISLEQVKYVVLDEADEMLNMGFQEDIDKILSYTMQERVTWLFSATMPAEIRKIIKKYMDKPLEVSINQEQKSNTDISHQYTVTTTSNKIPALLRFLDIQPEMRGIMFCRTKRETQQIADDLGGLGYGVEALHGDMSQAQRDTVMRRFKQRSMQLLVATDVAARGIDVNDLTHVIHHTLPDQLESYTHRSGRTGRAGRKGISLAFINPRERRKIDELERKIKIKFTYTEVPTAEEIRSSRIHHWANLISNIKVDGQADEIYRSLKDRFDHLSKDDLLKRLITTQLDHLAAQDEHANDLNEDLSSKKEGRGKGSALNRYFINLGFMDGITAGDLVHFVADTSGLPQNFIKDVSLNKSHSYFSVDAKNDSGLSSKFEGVEVEGRAIRVNRDSDPAGKNTSFKPGRKGRKRNHARRDKNRSSRNRRR